MPNKGRPSKPQFERSVFLPDIHIPYEDKRALKAALAFVRYFKPHVLFLLGDVMDMYGLAKFDNKDPSKLHHLADEIKQTREFLITLRKTTDAQINYIEGNHCLRLIKYIRNHAPELWELDALTIPSLLKLSDLGITYYPSGTTKYHGFVVKHGTVVRKHSGYTAMGELELAGVSGISGHTHRLGEIYRTNHSGMLKWVEAGCLCDLNPEYMEGQLTNWQQGLAYGFFEKGGNKFLVNTLPIIKGKIFYEGHILS